MTPAQKQWHDIKAQYRDCVIFFRLGDFYETFYEDAKICANVLDIVLTSRSKDPYIPMAGIPYHSVDKYISRLLKVGYKIAIAEQVGDVKPGQLVHREVIQVITPGTYIDENAKHGSVIMGIYYSDAYYLVWGEAVGTYHTKRVETFAQVAQIIMNFQPVEIILDMDVPESSTYKSFCKLVNFYDVPSDAERFILNVVGVRSRESFGNALQGDLIKVVALLGNYMISTKNNFIVQKISLSSDKNSVVLDQITIKNLELYTSNYDGSDIGLLKVIDRSQANGSRVLKQWLLSPTRNLATINHRLDLIDYFIHQHTLRHQLSSLFVDLPDMAKLGGLVLNKVKPLLFQKLKSTFDVIFSHAFLEQELVRAGCENDVIQRMKILHDRLSILSEDPEEFIADGVNEEIDELRKIVYNVDELILDYQKKLSVQTGLPIKIKRVQHYGYVIELTKKDSEKLSTSLTRIQTLKGSERYTTAYLQEIQLKQVDARNELEKIQAHYLEDMKSILLENYNFYGQFVDHIAKLDAIVHFAQLAYEKKFTRPTFSTSGTIEIFGGRHPVVEEYLDIGQHFVPNDSKLEGIQIITGPNMGGKSTYLRQNAIITLMAQCGLFVPAGKASISPVDGIFARIGSGDVLAKNQSTFMTEMIEMASILHMATKDSLIVIDELGRGTATYDGLALANAIVKHLTTIGSKVLFATHYHELTHLASTYPTIKNFSVAVHETPTEVVFLKKIIPGGANKSYGIDVAKIAGIPLSIIEDATTYLMGLEAKPIEGGLFEMAKFEDPGITKLRSILEGIDINALTGIDALKLLDQLKKMLKK